MSELVKGTNCGNCKWSAASKARNATLSDKLDTQNGIMPQTPGELHRAKMADLVTLPGKLKDVQIIHCNHPHVDQDVTTHNCCDYWDNEGCLRSFGKAVVGVTEPLAPLKKSVHDMAGQAYDELSHKDES